MKPHRQKRVEHFYSAAQKSGFKKIPENRSGNYNKKNQPQLRTFHPIKKLFFTRFVVLYFIILRIFSFFIGRSRVGRILRLALTGRGLAIHRLSNFLYYPCKLIRFFAGVPPPRPPTLFFFF